MKKAFIFALALFLVSCASGQSRKQAELHYKLGLSHIESEKYQPAFIEFHKALEYDPEDKLVHNGLGFVYLKFEDLQNAKKHFQKAASIDRNFSDAYNNLCLVNLRLKEYGQAAANCGKALENPLYETPEKAFYNLGMAWLKQGKTDQAIAAFRDALRRIGNFYPAYYGLALAYKAAGDYGAAGAALEKAVGLDPAFKGDMEKAEREFARRSALSSSGEEETESLLEIFRY